MKKFILIWHAEIPDEYDQFHALSVLFLGPIQKPVEDFEITVNDIFEAVPLIFS